MKINKNDILVHKEFDELILITSVKMSDLGLGVIWYTFENTIVHLTIGDQELVLNGTNRFPLIFPTELRKNYVKIGTLQ